tara:strand:+ start:2721 stop:3431 length:711 start_codon:yes stop_codon:yes gene_type:complete
MIKENQITKSVTTSFLTDSKTFEHTWRVATAFAKSKMIPKHFQNKPEDCMVALMMAQQLEVNPILALQNLQVIHGNVGFNSSFAIGLANERGNFLEPITWTSEGKGDDLAVTAHAILKTGKKISITVGMDTARKENWITNNKYKTMPEQMLRYRSATWLIRTHCPEVLLGMQSSEEIQDVEVTVPVGGSPVDKINKKVKQKINITEEANKYEDTNTKLENVINDSIDEIEDTDPFN